MVMERKYIGISSGTTAMLWFTSLEQQTTMIRCTVYLRQSNLLGLLLVFFFVGLSQGDINNAGQVVHAALHLCLLLHFPVHFEDLLGILQLSVGFGQDLN